MTDQGVEAEVDPVSMTSAMSRIAGFGESNAQGFTAITVNTTPRGVHPAHRGAEDNGAGKDEVQADISSGEGVEFRVNARHLRSMLGAVRTSEGPRHAAPDQPGTPHHGAPQGRSVVHDHGQLPW